MIPFQTERASRVLVAFMAICALESLNLLLYSEVEDAKASLSMALLDMR